MRLFSHKNRAMHLGPSYLRAQQTPVFDTHEYGSGKANHGLLSGRHCIAAGRGKTGYPAQEDSRAKI